MDVTCVTRNGITVLRADGDLDIATAAQFRRALLPAVAAGDVAVDLDGCTWLDSSGLGVLVGARKAAAREGHVLALACSQSRWLRVLELTSLHRVFPVFPAADDAVAALAGAS